MSLEFGEKLIEHCCSMRRHDDHSLTAYQLLQAMLTTMRESASITDATDMPEIASMISLDGDSTIDLCPTTTKNDIDLSLEKSNLSVVYLLLTDKGESGKSFRIRLHNFDPMKKTTAWQVTRLA